VLNCWLIVYSDVDVAGVIDENVDGSFVLPTVEICSADDNVNDNVWVELEMLFIVVVSISVTKMVLV
jgi:hypothetical protein